MWRGAATITTLFPLFVLLAAGIAYRHPEPFAAMRPAIPWLLGLVMLGVGMTISFGDLRRVALRPRDVGVGLGAQFLVMPVLAWLISLALQLPPELAAGVILLGCCPGGTASNVITFLARGDVALSVTLTAAATLLAPVATPFLTWLLAGSWVPVNASALLIDILKIVIVPVLLGLVINSVAGSRVRRLDFALTLTSVSAIVLIVAIVVALSAGRIATMGAMVFAAVVLHNGAGLGLGYLLARWLGLDAAKRRAVSIEVGMQNSGLAAALATVHFSPVAALPGALFSVWHNITGPALAAIWSRATLRGESK